MSSPKPLLYNPDQKSKQQLIAEFVIRQREFANLMQGLEAATPRTSPQHYLVVGQRGMGKTTLLLRVKYAVEDHPELKNWLVPIRFSEEQYQIARLDRFWEEIADHLSIADALFDGLLGEMEKHEEADDYERIALDLLIRALKKHKKRVLVMVDNLGDLFNKFSDEENHRLREILLSKTEIQLMGASSVMLEHTFRYDKPFYEFFEKITLEPINKEHAVELLRILGKQHGQEESAEQFIKENPTRIEVLRRLTGGVPRTMALLFGIFIDNQHGTTFEDLQLLIDQVNSLYKHRMDEMKPQQQRIVDALARAWDPISASEVLQRSKLNREGIATNQISAQLKVLTENQVVESIPGLGKNKTYRIRERFFNIWYLMRYGKKQHKEEVLWLVRFLETWCTKKELQFQAEEQMKALKLGNYSPQAAYYKTMALYHVEGIDSSQKLQLLEHAEAYLKVSFEDANARTIGKAKKSELDKCVGRIMEKMALNEKILVSDVPDVAPQSKIYIITTVAERTVELEIPLFKIKDLLEIGVKLGVLPFINLMAIAYYKLDSTIAEKYFKIAFDKSDTNAAFYLGMLYHNEKKNIELAEKYYLMAIDKDHPEAMFNLALLYEEQKKDIELAEKYYLMAVERNHGGAMFSLAVLYSIYMKNFELAEKYYLMAIDKDYPEAMFNVALIYQNEKKDLNLAKKYYMMAVERKYESAMLNLGLIYENEENIKLAEKYYLMAAEKGNTSAMINLAIISKNNKDFALSEKYYLMAAEKGHAGAMNSLALLYYGNENQKSEEYLRLSHSLGYIMASINLIVYYSINSRTEEMLQVVAQIIDKKDFYQDEKEIIKVLYHILEKKQYHFLMQLFRNAEIPLMKYARPFYYVLAWFMRDELPGEYEKVGPEIKETVDEIIQQLQTEYDTSEVLEREMKD
jgi:TPR repeat protein